MGFQLDSDIALSLLQFMLFSLFYFLVDFTSKNLLKKYNHLTQHFLTNAIKTFIVISGIIVFLLKFEAFKGVFSVLLTNSAILVAVVAFTLQNTIKNIIAGTLLLSSDVFKVGDRIRIPKEDIAGEIEELTLRHAKIKLATSERAIIPNYLLNDAVVINNNLHNQETCYPLIVPVKNTIDLLKAQVIIEDIVFSHPDIINKEFSSTILTNVTTTSSEFHTMIWTKDMSDSFRVLSELRIAIINAFQKNHFY